MAGSSAKRRSPWISMKSCMRSVDVIEGVRPLGVAGDLDDLGRRQIGTDLGPLLLDLEAEGGDLFLGPPGSAFRLRTSIRSLSSMMGFSS